VIVPLPGGRVIEAQLPSYHMPQVRKHASGYYVAPGMDVLDLFIGSEGTLGVIVEVEVKLLPKPEGILSGVVFFNSAQDVLSFVAGARARSLETRVMKQALSVKDQNNENARMDARALEYFDLGSLGFLRQKYETIPQQAVGAIFFEQETTAATEDSLMSDWLSLLDEHHALSDDSCSPPTNRTRQSCVSFGTRCRY